MLCGLQKPRMFLSHRFFVSHDWRVIQSAIYILFRSESVCNPNKAIKHQGHLSHSPYEVLIVLKPYTVFYSSLHISSTCLFLVFHFSISLKLFMVVAMVTYLSGCNRDGICQPISTVSCVSIDYMFTED